MSNLIKTTNTKGKDSDGRTTHIERKEYSDGTFKEKETRDDGLIFPKHVTIRTAEGKIKK